MKFKLIGSFLFSFGLFCIAFSIADGRPANALWFCYIGLVVMGAGIFFDKPRVVISQLNILLIPIFLWILDFVLFLIIGEPVLGISDYFFFQGGLVLKVISLQHFFSVPLGIYYIRKTRKIIGKTGGVLLISIMQLFVVFFSSRIVNTNGENINFVLRNSTPLKIVESISVNWFIMGVMSTVIGYIIITRIIRKTKRFIKRSNILKR